MPKKKSGYKFTVVSTFSGCGGSSLGYKLAGGKVLMAVENDKNAANTYRLNFPDTDLYFGDIAVLTVDEVFSRTGLRPGELDVFDGSPPCQGFSSAGKRQMSDKRNVLFEQYVRLLKGLQPKVFVMENVPGLITGNMKFIFAQIVKDLKSAGYRVKAKVLNAKNYQVAQSRERLIFIGIREDLQLDPVFPVGSTNIISCKEALIGVKIDEAEREYLLKVGAENKSYQYWDVIPIGQSLAKVLQRNYGYSLVRLDPNKPCYTITKSQANIKMYGMRHWSEKRAFAVAEFKRFASYPDSFQFSGKYSDAVARIGNSVPPNLMKAIASTVYDSILRE